MDDLPERMRTMNVRRGGNRSGRGQGDANPTGSAAGAERGPALVPGQQQPRLYAPMPYPYGYLPPGQQVPYYFRMGHLPPVGAEGGQGAPRGVGPGWGGVIIGGGGPGRPGETGAYPAVRPPSAGTPPGPSPERPPNRDQEGGRTPCAFFLKTGTCAYGNRCKFEHPLDRMPLVDFNSLGLPMRPGEPECAFFMKNMRCGFGTSCKFHHPEPMAAPMMGWGMQPHMQAGAAMAPVPSGLMPMPYTMVLASGDLATMSMAPEGGLMASQASSGALRSMPSYGSLSSIERPRQQQAERARRERPRRVQSAEAQPLLLSSDEATGQRRQAALSPEEARGAPEEGVDTALSAQQPPHRHLKPEAAAAAATQEHMAEPGEDLLEAAENARHD